MPQVNEKLVLTTEVKGSKKAESQIKGINKEVGSLGKTAKILKIGLIAAGTGLAFLGKSAITAAGQFEQSQIAFETMLGSAEEGQRVLNELSEFAKRTPFTLVGIESTAKQLLAVGIETDRLMPTLKSLGDVSAGLSVPIERLALNFGQVKTQGKLTGRELRDFAIAGVPLLGQLATQLGKSKEEIQKMVSAGKIGFNEVEQAFTDMTSEGGRFNDLMDKQSKSLNGMISNLGDAWNIFLRGEGQALLEWGKLVIGFMINFVENVLPNVILGVKSFASNFMQTFSNVGIDFGSIWDGMLIKTKQFVEWIKINLVPTIKFLSEAFVEGLRVIKTAWDENFLGMQTIVGGIFDTIKFIWDQLVNGIELGLALLRGDFSRVWDEIKQIVFSAIDAMKSVITGFIDTVKNAMNSVKTFIGLGSDIKAPSVTVNRQYTGVPFDEQKADGGPVQSGKTFLVGEEGPELFTPRVSGNISPNGSFGGLVVNILGGNFGEDAGDEIGDQIFQRLSDNYAI